MTRKDVILQILDRERTNRPLNDAAIQKEAAELYQVACELFGLWEIALQYAGVDNPYNFTRSNLLQAIRRRQSRLKCLDGFHVERRFPSLYAAALKYYDSWNAALWASGINPENVSRYPCREKPSRQQIINAIIERRTRGLSLQRVDVSCENYRFVCTTRNLFGSWMKACEAAGVISQPSKE